jgi:hypothetical protein
MPAVNDYQTGFQLNTTIHAAFWIYKPDFRYDAEGKEIFVNVNALQYVEVNQPVVKLPQISSISIAGGILTIVGTNSFQSGQQAALINGLQNALFLNGLIVPLGRPTPQQITATMPPIVGAVSNISISNNVLTVTANQNFVVGMTVTLSGLVNATFLNGQTVTIVSVSRNFSDPSGFASFTAELPNSPPLNYANTGCGAGNDIGFATLNTDGYSNTDVGSVSDPSSRQVWLYYDSTNVTISERAYIIKGVAAQSFINDMEDLFQQ